MALIGIPEDTRAFFAERPFSKNLMQEMPWSNAATLGNQGFSFLCPSRVALHAPLTRGLKQKNLVIFLKVAFLAAFIFYKVEKGKDII